MEFSLNKQGLFKELNLLQGVVEKKNTIPILSNVLIETTSESLISLVATDLDVSLKTECAADVTRPGAVVLQARKLFDIVRNLPDADINFIREDNNWVKVICGAAEFKVVGQAKEHFPETPKAEKKGFQLPSAVLNSLINRTIYAITQEESRYALNGALFLLADDKIQMVATDGHRLALATGKLETPAGYDKSEPLRAIIPKKALAELAKLTAGSEEALEFAKDENHLYFKLGQRELTSRMLSGQFPNYEMVLPKNNDKVIPINANKLAQAIRRAALMADERSHGVRFEFGSGRINISSQSADVGEAREVLPIDYDGESVSIGFNANYLLDFFNVVGSEEVIFEFKDGQSPALMRPVEAGQQEYQYVIMPMRLM
ncbi:MAG TPA: DNA polymerase III subunit beta [Blastocatellia bacterium]|nr:DNA polymerase III subunit beta [Blastocatellia bacterium]